MDYLAYCALLAVALIYSDIEQAPCDIAVGLIQVDFVEERLQRCWRPIEVYAGGEALRGFSDAAHETSVTTVSPLKKYFVVAFSFQTLAPVQASSSELDGLFVGGDVVERFLFQNEKESRRSVFRRVRQNRLRARHCDCCYIRLAKQYAANADFFEWDLRIVRHINLVKDAEKELERAA